MKHYSLICLAVLAALPVLSQAATTTGSVDSGSVHITGEVVANTCTVTSGTNGVHEVALPKVSTKVLATTGDTAGKTPFTITLANCTPDNGKVSIYFEPGSDTDMATGNLKNATTTGTNAEVQLLNGDATGSAISLNQGVSGQHVQQVDLQSGGASLPFFAQYIAATAPATVGTLSSTTKFTVTYP